MNEQQEPPKEGSQQADIEILTGDVLPDQKDQSIAVLEERTEKYRDSRLEERFLSIFAVIILVDMMVFQSMPWFGVILIGLLELIFLAILGRTCGVDDVLVLTERAVAALGKLNGKPKD
jgi:hypothetical protein